MIGVRRFIRQIAGDDLGRLIARGASSALIINVTAAAALFGSYLVASNILSPRSFGDYVYVINWLNVLTLFTTLGLDTAALKFVPRYTANRELALLKGFVGQSRLLVFSASVATALVLGIGVILVSSHMRHELTTAFAIGCLLLLVLSLLRLVAVQVQATKHIVMAHAPIFVGRPILTAAGIIIVFLVVGRVSGPTAMVANLIATSISLVLTLVAAYLTMPTTLRSIKPKIDQRQWLRVAPSFVMYTGFVYLMQRVDILMLGAMNGTENAGLYSVAAQVATLVVFGLHAVVAITTPIISELSNKDDKRKLQEILKLASGGAFIVATIAVIVLIGAGSWILRLFGPSFSAAYSALTILCGGMLVFATMGLSSAVMNMTNHHKPAALSAGVALGVNIALNAILIPRYGIDGAAIATAASMILLSLTLMIYVYRKLKLNPTILPLSWL